MAPVLEQIAHGRFDVYDIAAMLLIYYRALQRKPDEEFGQIFIATSLLPPPWRYFRSDAQVRRAG